MDLIASIKNLISREIGRPLDLVYPPNPELGNLSLAVFDLAKEKKQAPVVLATEIATKLQNNKKLKKIISKIQTAGPYINFFVNPEYLLTETIKTISRQTKNYGHQKSTRGAGIMIEFSNANTHKEYHVGHLRNICYGAAVTAILQANGQRALPVSYINDFGIHVAKTLWNYQKNYQKQSLDNPGLWLGKIYAEASQKLKDDPVGAEEVSQIMQAIESRRGATYKLWQTTRQWSLKYFNQIYKELNIKFVKTFYEHEVIDQGLKIVTELTKKNILVKSDGAIIANLESDNLGVLPIIRSDGTALYPVADLALASEKFKKYKLQESIYIVDVRQSLYFKQLFKIIEKMGYQQKLTHLAYDFVTLPSGMMSSRTGNVITYHQLLNEALTYTQTETTKRHPDWTTKKIQTTAKILAISTLKFEMLKVSANRTITFDIQEALKFDGYTATYLQYTYARLQSIFRKAATTKTIKIDYKKLTEAKEFNLAWQLARYPEIIKKAGANYDPSEIAKYLFDLAKIVNDYYHEIPILKSAPEIASARLALLQATTQTIANGLNTLGIQAVSEI